MADFFRHSFDVMSGSVRSINGTTFTNHILDAAGDSLEFIVNAPEAITITKLGYRYGARTGTPPTYKVSLQGVAGTGRADGTIKGGGSPASKTFTPPADATLDGTWIWQTLDNSYACARGENLAVVLKHDSGSVDASNCSSFTRNCTSMALCGHPFAWDNAGNTSQFPVFGYGSASKAYGHPLEATSFTSFNSGSTPDEMALRFSLDSGWGATYKIVGVRGKFYPGGTNRSAKIILYSGTTVLQDYTVDAEQMRGTSSIGGNDESEFYFDEASLTELNHGDVYRLALQPQEASNWVLPCIDVDAANDLTAYAGEAEWHYSERTNAGAWSDITTRRPLWMPIFDEWTEPAGGGGGLVSPIISSAKGGGLIIRG